MDVVSFVGGTAGDWQVSRMDAVVGQGLAAVASVQVESQEGLGPSAWRLRGIASNLRYTTRAEVGALRRTQPQLGRGNSTRAALIPIRKSAEWWESAQDERRKIFEETSRHTTIGLEYLPAIARKLHHSRDLGEPFDFLTWFEFAPADEPAFDELVGRLRRTAEWEFVEREVEIRLSRREG